MEGLLAYILTTLRAQPSVGGMISWLAFVTLIIWAPVAFPERWAKTKEGGISLIVIPFASLLSSLPSLPLLEVTALGLTASLLWLEHRRKAQKDKDADRHPLQRQSQDALNTVRLALWATLALMPIKGWC
ncbi:MAG: hypothetical protein C4295_04895 [Candidatus Fervidibacterota bacterium]